MVAFPVFRFVGEELIINPFGNEVVAKLIIPDLFAFDVTPDPIGNCPIMPTLATCCDTEVAV
jgi:hypothetical protein